MRFHNCPAAYHPDASRQMKNNHSCRIHRGQNEQGRYDYSWRLEPQRSLLRMTGSKCTAMTTPQRRPATSHNSPPKGDGGVHAHASLEARDGGDCGFGKNAGLHIDERDYTLTS